MPATGLEELRALPLFDGLDDEQLGALVAAGAEHPFGAGEELFGEGQPADAWWVLLEGTITLLRRVGTEESALGLMSSPGQWAGGFQAWDPHGVYFATGRATTPGRAFRLPADRLATLADSWFPFGVHFIQGLANTVRRIESAARQREALVALGTLAAGLAHEINNPASAATRAVEALAGACDALLTSLAELGRRGISAEQYVELDGMRRSLGPRTTALSPLAAADLEDDLSEWMSAHGVERDWLLAPPLVAAGVDVSFCEQVREVLGDAALGGGLEWLANSLTIAGLLEEIKDSTGRISDLVAAVRSYSQLDRASLQETDLREGIESTLVMLAHRLGDGVTVVREYADDVPRIEAMAGELNQVWTNLIDNAVDAMNGSGTLRVSTATDGLGRVVVEIADDGAGMPKEVQARAFEPFYTTKDVGKGTGLGLDISRRIVVERHNGEIEIDSRPGRTVLRVLLPTSRRSHTSEG
jgi:signal transduction histidine kinase